MSNPDDIETEKTPQNQDAIDEDNPPATDLYVLNDGVPHIPEPNGQVLDWAS